MNLAALIATARERLDDEIEPYLITDASLAGWATEGEREACLRARLLFDDEPGEVTTVTLALGQGVYSLDARALFVVSATITWSDGTQPAPLDLKGLDWIRERSRQESSFGTPCVLADDGRARIHLWPRPVRPGRLQLAVYRAPMRALLDPLDEPEIAPKHHEALIDWMLYRAFQIKDREIEDVSRAVLALREFTLNFGERPTADVQRRHRERRRSTTRYGGY
ncbi:phage adaptor protein [Lysobacter sp. CA199]|uniref:phage adaptor protein n=1 Tax=Lysobacter sp. CA199 TaxID=3455608 RepID=UPI003F8D609E